MTFLFWIAALLFAQSSPQQLLISQKITSGGGTPPAFVTSTSNDSGGNNQTTIATNAWTVTAGNLLHLAFGSSNDCGALSITSVSDTASNTFTSIATQDDPSLNMCLYHYYAKNVSGNASDVITVTFSTTANFPWVVANQFSGASVTSPLASHTEGGTSSSGTVTSGSSTASASQTTSALGGTYQGSFNGTWGAGSGFTLPAASLSTFKMTAGEYNVGSRSGTVSLTNTAAPTIFTIGVAVFQ